MSIRRSVGAVIEHRRDTVAGSLLFRGLPETLIEHVASCCTERRLGEGDALFFKNDPGEFLAIVAQGRLYKILHGPRGQELILDSVCSGEAVDEGMVFDQQSRSFTVMAYGPATVLSLPRRHFSLLLDNPAFVQRVNAAVREKLRETVDSMEILCLHHLESRLARRILAMMRGGTTTRDEAEVELPPTQTILAAMVNASRPKLNAQLQEWRRIGLISCYRNIVRIHDVDALRRKAGLACEIPRTLVPSIDHGLPVLSPPMTVRMSV